MAKVKKMQKEFLRLVERLRSSGVIERICMDASTLEETEAIWDEFKENNPQLVSDAHDWKEKFVADGKVVFDANDDIPDPVAVALLIELFGDCEDASEYEIFEEFMQLQSALEDSGDLLGISIAAYLEDGCLGGGTLFDGIYSIEP